jgi:hypothetical protein
MKVTKSTLVLKNYLILPHREVTCCTRSFTEKMYILLWTINVSNSRIHLS